MSSNIAERWRILSGENEWEGLLDPDVDIDLRSYIINYGDKLTAACACVTEPKSPNIGLPRYSAKTLFDQVGVVKGNRFMYDVKAYFYASYAFVPDQWKVHRSAGDSSWVGYVAVATDEGKEYLGRRDIVIAWRGTLLYPEIYIDCDCRHLQDASHLFGTDYEPKVQLGWYSYYTTYELGSKYNPNSCRDQVIDAVKALVEQYKDEELSVTVTGHSMGAALAVLNATDIAINVSNKAFPVTAFVFACPRPGDKGFASVVSGLENLHVLCVNNIQDPVPDSPPSPYADVGIVLSIDSEKSPYLKTGNKKPHELQVYLHVVAGTQGKDGSGEFNLVVDRDLALLNKDADLLKDGEYENFPHGVVAAWFIPKNKSMAQKDDGKWVLMDHEVDHDDKDE